MLQGDLSASAAGYAGLTAGQDQPGSEHLGPGTVGRTMLIVWGVSLLWLIIVWRVAEGY